MFFYLMSGPQEILFNRRTRAKSTEGVSMVEDMVGRAVGRVAGSMASRRRVAHYWPMQLMDPGILYQPLLAVNSNTRTLLVVQPVIKLHTLNNILTIKEHTSYRKQGEVKLKRTK